MQRKKTLSWQIVLAAIRRVGVPESLLQAPKFTLVNLKTTFYTHAHPVDRSLALIGFGVNVRVTPTAYLWHWGDGTTDSTTIPGRPYPSTDVTHTYLRTTDGAAPLSLRVDTVYTAQYQVDGGVWQQIPEQLTIGGATTAMPVKQASAVLVAGD